MGKVSELASPSALPPTRPAVASWSRASATRTPRASGRPWSSRCRPARSHWARAEGVAARRASSRGLRLLSGLGSARPSSSALWARGATGGPSARACAGGRAGVPWCPCLRACVPTCVPVSLCLRSLARARALFPMTSRIANAASPERPRLTIRLRRRRPRVPCRRTAPRSPWRCCSRPLTRRARTKMGRGVACDDATTRRCGTQHEEGASAIARLEEITCDWRSMPPSRSEGLDGYVLRACLTWHICNSNGSSLNCHDNICHVRANTEGCQR